MFFFQDTDEKMLNSTGQELISRASLETHPCDDESSLPVAFGDLSVSQLLIHYKYVMLIVYHLFFFLFELSGSTKSKAIKDYITLALILLSIDIKLV